MMSKAKKIAVLLVAGAAGILGAHQASASVVFAYTFPTLNAGPLNTVSATTGTGTAIQLGMTNSYTYANGEGPGSSAACDIVNTAGSSITENTWRIRGNSNAKNAGPGNANGWNNSAPNYTQGAEFGGDTTGFTPTLLTFDWFSTNQGVANLQVRYTTDGTNFTNLGSDFIATPNDFVAESVSLASLPAGAANDPNFGIELVSVRPLLGDANYQAAGPGGDGNYSSATAATGAAGDYNNNSGNWRFDNVTVSGTAIPEPASASLLGLAGLALLGRRRQK